MVLNIWSNIGKTFLPSLTWQREESEKVVYLTFDDGPHPTITPWVHALLAQYDSKGTFFVVGENAEKYPEVMDLLQANGHAIGNHTQHHMKGWGKSKEAYLQDIEMCAQIINHKRLFRPPFGRINFRAMTEICAQYEVIMWDVLTKDYLPSLNHVRALERIKKDTQPGSIVVFHDSMKAESNLRVLLPQYLTYLKENGYSMKAL